MRTAVLVSLWILSLCACVDPLPAIPRSQLNGNVRPLLEERIQAELDRRSAEDPTLAEWLADNELPDYVSFDSERSTTLFYVERDLYASFSKPRFSSVSDPPVSGSIRAPHHRFFSNADRERLGDLRRERAQVDELERRRRAQRAYSDSLPDPPAPPEDDAPASPER